MSNQNLSQLNPEFVAFLEKFPQFLAQFVNLIKNWYELQQNPSLPPATTGGGPKHFEIGGKQQLQTTEITDEFLEAISKSYATAEVKEKAIAYVKGFISGVMFAS